MDTNKLLRDNGFHDPKAFKYAADLAKAGRSSEEILMILREQGFQTKIKVNNKPLPYAKFGELGVDIPYNAMDQMDEVMRIPPALKGALMPDAHHGYAMPIGGVVGLLNAVSPSFVGYDIACRMTVSLLDIDVHDFRFDKERFLEDMRSVTRFGLGSNFDKPHDHAVMHHSLWNELPHLKDLKPLAQEQLGSSGGGNHFFDALVGEVITPVHWLTNSYGEVLEEGDNFVAIMTHSGSRGVGHKMARYYQKLAERQTRSVFTGIQKGYEWLNLSSEAGSEYWAVMSLMGTYAQANHHLIHESFSIRAGVESFGLVENHHNFAWIEDGMVVHRKGATPAAPGQIGIIPGSSGSASFLVEGLGNTESLNSSSHGAGRPHSRSQAKKQHDQELYTELMEELNVLTAGVAPDETVLAYKDIERVIALQDGVLVNVVARMKPELVVMGGKSDDGD
ncbi:MAG: RtcB family protein [Candidatus Thorarchaeota archaeon]|jgi:tRNA-splicing ligase RtcB